MRSKTPQNTLFGGALTFSEGLTALTVGRKSKCCANVVFVQVWEVRHNIRRRHTCGDKDPSAGYDGFTQISVGQVSLLRVELSKATIAEKPIVDNLSQFYLYEFSQYMPSLQLEEHCGLYHGLPDLDAYWDDPNREPFIIRVDGELAGFVLVKKGVADEPHQIGEFFVMQKFGGKGIGTSAAKSIFDMFPGNWLIHEMWNNYKAQAFWHGVVHAYTNGHYEEYYDEQQRPFQKFSTPER